jgi:hypothetical protein
VEALALLAAACSPSPPPACELVPDPTLAADLFPEDPPRLLKLVVVVYQLVDGVKVVLFPGGSSKRLRAWMSPGGATCSAMTTCSPNSA